LAVVALAFVAVRSGLTGDAVSGAESVSPPPAADAEPVDSTVPR
jgi:hypothetical protein